MAFLIEFCNRRKRDVIIISALLLFTVPSLLTYQRYYVGEDVTESAAAKTPQGPKDEYLAICIAVKDQALDLPEWLQHHYYNMGVGKFYIMDDGSNPPLESFVDTYGVPQSSLEFHYFEKKDHTENMQYTIYNKCNGLAQGKHTWVAYIDADEFFDAPGPETMREVLESFDPIPAIGAVGVNWRMHTSNGRLTRAESVRRDYTTCVFDDPEHGGDKTDNNHIKSIVRPANYKAPSTPHNFELKDAITVGEHGELLNNHMRKPITRDRLALHHYAVKSREEMEAKMNRGSAMNHQKGWDFWDHVETGIEHIDCPEMARWVVS